MNTNNEQTNEQTNEQNKEQIKEQITEQIKKQTLDVRYTYLISAHFISTVIFAGIYYYLISNFKTYLINPNKYNKKYWLYYKLLASFYISIQFQTLIIYLDIHCKTYIAWTIIVTQICLSLLLTFYILLNY